MAALHLKLEFATLSFASATNRVPALLVLYIIGRVRIGGFGGKKCRECSEGKLMWVSGLKLKKVLYL